MDRFVHWMSVLALNIKYNTVLTKLHSKRESDITKHWVIVYFSNLFLE